VGRAWLDAQRSNARLHPASACDIDCPDSRASSLRLVLSSLYGTGFMSKSLTGFVRGRLHQLRAAREQRQALAGSAPLRLERGDWARSLVDPTGFYLDCFRFFHQRLPSQLRDHRAYFTRNRRGFGEDAFHVLWFLLFGEFRPASFLEIGVYRGQTLSLAALLSRLNHCACEVCGISPFTSAGDSVSSYGGHVDYQRDTLANFDHFQLPPPRLLKALSTDPEAVQTIGGGAWDMIYIDGNHDYEVVVRDWEHCSRGVKPGGVMVLDDSALATPFHPPAFATQGHPGPSRLAQELDRSQFREILQVGHNRAFQRVA
jgi:hypothetical protein